MNGLYLLFIMLNISNISNLTNFFIVSGVNGFRLHNYSLYNLRNNKQNNKYFIIINNKKFETIDSDGKSNIWAFEPKITFVSQKNSNIINSKNWALFLLTLSSMSIILVYLQAMTPILSNY